MSHWSGGVGETLDRGRDSSRHRDATSLINLSLLKCSLCSLALAVRRNSYSFPML